MKYLFTFGPVLVVIVLIFNLFDYLSDREREFTKQEQERTIQLIIQKEGVAAAEKYRQSTCQSLQTP